MENDTDKIIQDQIDALPMDVKEAIARVPWKDRIRDIAKREGLNVAQTDSLETETMLILFGFLTPDTYTGNIISEVGVGDEQAERIAKIVNDEIILDIEKQFEMIDALMPENIAKETGHAPEKAPVQAPQEAISNEPTPSPLTKELDAPIEALPEIVPGETAHDTSPKTTLPPEPTKQSMPQGMIGEKLSGITSALPVENKPAPYPKGIDPYREPIE